MTVALIALFVSLAMCALIGWGFIRVLGIIAQNVRRRPKHPTQRASDPSNVFQDATAREVAEPARIQAEPAAERSVETYFENGRWKNKVHGNSRASNVHETHAAAVTAGREMARKRRVEHIIRSEGGTVQERSNYGNDPRPVRS